MTISGVSGAEALRSGAGDDLAVTTRTYTGSCSSVSCVLVIKTEKSFHSGDHGTARYTFFRVLCPSSENRNDCIIGTDVLIQHISFHKSRTDVPMVFAWQRFINY